MKPNAKAFLLLIVIAAVAFELAVFLHDRNEAAYSALLAERTAKQLAPQLSHATAPIVEPAPVVPEIPPVMVAPSTPIVFQSADKVAEAVLVGYPVLASPFTFYGTGTAFESQMSWRLRDAKRALLAEGSFMVHSPDMGIPGPFRETVTFEKTPATTSGTLFIFEASAKDGTPIHVVSIPVRFATSPSL